VVEKRNITLVGQFPPPNGGISIPVKKIYDRLKNNEKTLDVNVIDISFNSKYEEKGDNIYTLTGNKLSLFLKTLRSISKHKNYIVHFHVAGFGMFFLVGHLLHLVCKDRFTILTIHGGDFKRNYKNSSYTKKYLIYKLIEKFNKVITVNVEQKDFLQEKFQIASDVIPVFDTPTYLKEKVDLKLKEYIMDFTNKFNKIIMFTGMMLDYYGLDILLRAFKYLVNQNNIGLIIVLYGEHQDEEFKFKILKLINEVNSNVKIFKKLEQQNFYYLLKNSDIFVRPTHWDGDSSALREAAYFQNQVIASDCTWRPNGVVTFENKSYKDLTKKLTKVINNNSLGILDSVEFDNTSKIINIYKDIIGIN